MTRDARAAPPPPSDDLFIYPQNGQSSEQQASDKYECHQWAVGQTGFDPTQAGGGLPPSVAATHATTISARCAPVSRAAATACADGVRRARRQCGRRAGFCPYAISTCPTLMRPSGRPIQRATRFCTRAGSA